MQTPDEHQLKKMPEKSSYQNTNGMPRLDNGGTIHLSVGPGQGNCGHIPTND